MKVRRRWLLTLLIVISVSQYTCIALASEAGVANNEGEIEFYLEENLNEPTNKQKGKDGLEGKKNIKLPQTSNQIAEYPSLIGGMLIVTITFIGVKRRNNHENSQY